MLKINKNLIFSKFLKIVKNTLAPNVTSNTYHLFVVVPKIATQTDSLAFKRALFKYSNFPQDCRNEDTTMAENR